MTTDFLLQTMQARTVEQYFQSTERKKNTCQPIILKLLKISLKKLKQKHFRNTKAETIHHRETRTTRNVLKSFKRKKKMILGVTMDLYS